MALFFCPLFFTFINFFIVFNEKWRIFILLIKHLRTMKLEHEVAFSFDYTYKEGEPQTYDHPGTGPEVEITKVWMNDVDIPLGAISESLYDAMIEHVLENHD